MYVTRPEPVYTLHIKEFHTFKLSLTKTRYFIRHSQEVHLHHKRYSIKILLFTTNCHSQKTPHTHH